LPGVDVEIVLGGLGRFPDASDPRLAGWLARLVAALAPHADSFGVRFVGDRAMRALNLEYRGLDCSTDVLSFEGGSSPEGRHLGDVVISVPYARRQAEVHRHALAAELRLLLLHGLLHCLGHDHETDSGVMDRLEQRLRRRFVPRRRGRLGPKPARRRAAA
jgi:probable rRNA maturation factor